METFTRNKLVSHAIVPILRFSHQVPVFSYIYFCKGVAVNNY